MNRLKLRIPTASALGVCQAIFRTDEYKHQKGSPDYGGIAVGCSW